MHSRLLMLCMLLLIPMHAIAEGPVYPNSISLRDLSSEGFNILTGECHKTGSITLSCNFVQTMIRHKAHPNKIDEEIEAELAEATEQDLKKAIQELANDKLCGPEGKAEIERVFEENPKKLSKEEFEERMRDLKVLRILCEDPTETGLRRFLRAMKTVEAKTCKVWNNPWNETFEYRAESGKWVSKKGPSGLCGTINISALYQAPGQKESWEWTYDTQKVVTNKEGFLCEGLDETPARYSFSYDNKYMNCKYLEYGL